MGSIALSRFAPLLGQRLAVRGPARLLFRSYANFSPPPGESVLRLTTKFGDHFEADLSSFLEWSLWAFGAYEEHLALLFGQLVRPGDRCIDVGANIGIHTARLAKLAGAGGEVIAIEADQDVLGRACHNIRLNRLDNVRLIHAAASERGGEEVLLYRPADTDPNKARASLLPHDHLTGPAARLRTVAIDDLTSDPVTLIKIDVEGHETEVVMGARRTIAEHSPAIVWEYAPELRAAGSLSPFGWLAERRYQLFDIQPYRQRVTGRSQLRLAPLAELPESGTNILAAAPPMAARVSPFVG